MQLTQVEYPGTNEAGTELTPSSAPCGTGDSGESFSVQQVLQLRYPGAIRKTPDAVKLLYLDGFDFQQKIRINDSFDKKGNKVKLSTSELRKQRRELQNQLRDSKSLVKIPPLHKIKALPSAKILLAPPTTHANIYPRSSQLSQAALSLDPVKFTEREKVRMSLSAYLASHKQSDEEISKMKKMAKTKEARDYIVRLETDDLWNLDVSIMYYYPYFKRTLFTLKAPFIRPVETSYCRPELSNQPLVQQGSKVFEMSSDELAIQETLDSQLVDPPITLSAFAKSLDKKLKLQAGEDEPVDVPETFSRQCIQWHIQFTCDLVYKMIKLCEVDTQDIRERLANTLDGLLDSLNALSGHIAEFPDEFIMVTESLCILLQSSPLQRLLTLQESEVPGEIKEVWHNSVKQLEDMILMILVKSLQYPGLLNSTMCLFKTISEHRIYRTIQTDSSKVFITRLARVSSEIAKSLLRSLTSHFLDDISTHDQFIEQIKSCCLILNEVNLKVIQKYNPDHTESQNLGNSIKTLNEACKARLKKNEEARQAYIDELESEKNNKKEIIRENMEKRKQSKQKREAREKRNNQLKEEITSERSEPLEKKEQESDYAKLINDMSSRLQLFSEKLEYGEDYEHELKTVDSEFPETQQSPVLAVWVFGDLAYNLWNKCMDQFNRAILFVDRYEKMRIFCDAAFEEASRRPWEHDSKWLYDRDPDQPVSISSIDFLTKLSDPKQVQALIKRAFESVSLYEVALNRARDATHQLTQDMMVDAVNTEKGMQLYHLQQRVGFIIEEMNDVKQYLKNLQPVPGISDLLSTRKQLFRVLKTKGITVGQAGGTAGNQDTDVRDSLYELLLEKSESEWKVDSSVCDMRNSAEQKLEKVIKGFTELKQRLGAEDLEDYMKCDLDRTISGSSPVACG